MRMGKLWNLCMQTLLSECCCVLCIHSLKLSLKHNEEKTMLFAVRQILSLFIYSMAFSQETIFPNTCKIIIWLSRTSKNGSIKLTSLIITVTLISCTKWLFYCRNKIHFMVIHKMYCFLFILLLKLLHYFHYSHYIMCELLEYEDCSSCDMFLCQFETQSE